jgi:hypothetical protein
MPPVFYRLRIPLMLLALAALLVAMWGGLLRMGWRWPAVQAGWPGAHGPLMVAGFLGTVIGLERAVALNRRWTYAGPVLTGLGGLAFLAGLPAGLGALLITLGSLGLVAIFVEIVRRQPALFSVTMGVGALAWLAGNALWLAGRPVPRVVLWWMVFLVLTVAGERLELARILRPSRASQAAFAAAVGLFLGGAAVAAINFDAGTRLAGAGMLGLAAWLLRYDVARLTVRRPGVARFIAVCLLAGYVWLAAGGAMGLAFGGTSAGPLYDAFLHAVFLGFIFSMIFGHAPIVIPAVLRRPLAFSRTFYAPLALLHLSLLLRVAGDLAGAFELRRWGGLLNAVVLLLFLANTARVTRASARPQEEMAADRQSSPQPAGGRG